MSNERKVDEMPLLLWHLSSSLRCVDVVPTHTSCWWLALRGAIDDEGAAPGLKASHMMWKARTRVMTHKMMLFNNFPLLSQRL